MKVKEFDNDLQKGREAEELVYQLFSSLTNEYMFEMVGDQPQYYHKGDIKAIAPDGREIMIEVKNDSVIGTSGNVLLEEEVYYKKTDSYQRGFLYNDYEIYAVVSMDKRQIYIFDFKILKEIFRKGESKRIHHSDQYSDCYLLHMGLVKKYNALLEIVRF